MQNLNPIQSTITDYISREVSHRYPIPDILHQCVRFLQNSSVFVFYKLYQTTQLENPKESLIGGGLAVIASEALLLKQCLDMVLYIKITTDIIDQYRQLYESLVTLSDNAKNRFPLYQKKPWRFHLKNRSFQLTPDMQLLDQDLQKFGRYLYRIAICVKNTLFVFFKLVVSLRDFILVTQDDKFVKIQACSEIVDRWKKDLEQFRSNLLLLKDFLLSNKNLGTFLSDSLGLKSVDQLNISLEKEYQVKTVKNPFKDYLEIHKEAVRSLTEVGQVNFSDGSYYHTEIQWDRFVPIFKVDI